MRLTAIELADGWTKFTVSWAVVLKLCQLTERFWLAWVMVVVVPAWVMEPEPETTCPPVGAAKTKPGKSSSAAAISLRAVPLPRPRAFSATAIHALSTGLQIRR